MPDFPNIFGNESIMQLSPEQIAKQLGVDLSLSGKLEEQVEEFVEQVKKIQETIDFGTPDVEQQKMIDSLDDDFREKIKGRLKFTENTINISISYSNTLIFPKKQTINEKLIGDFADGILSNIGQRLLTNEEYSKLFLIFSNKQERDFLKKILNINDDYYWTDTHITNFDQIFACYINFGNGKIYSDNLNSYKHVLLVYN